MCTANYEAPGKVISWDDMYCKVLRVMGNGALRVVLGAGGKGSCTYPLGNAEELCYEPAGQPVIASESGHKADEMKGVVHRPACRLLYGSEGCI